MIKECFIDTETTSLDVSKAEVWQVGGILRVGKEITPFEFTCDIFEDDYCDSATLEMCNKTQKDFMKFPDPAIAYEGLTKLLDERADRYNPQDKFFFIGYGAEFDAKILRRWFDGFGDKFFGARFFHPWICVMTLAAHALREIRHEMPDFKLQTVLDYCGIEYQPRHLHSARYDAEMAMVLYDKMVDEGVGDRTNEPGQIRNGKFEPLKKLPNGKRLYKLDKRRRA